MILMILDSNHSISFKLLSFLLPKLFLTDLTRAHTSLPLSPFHPSIRSPSAPFWELSVLGDFCLPTASVRTAGNAYAWSLKSAMGRWRRTLESEMQISEMMKFLNPQASQSHTWPYHSMLPTSSLSASGWGNRFVACNGGPFVVIFGEVMGWVPVILS